MKKEFLLIGATHGDEAIGARVLEQLQKERSDFDWRIGNPKAYEQGTRCFEGDLNRSAPGDKDSAIYEERRATELLELAKNYRYCIDLHGTISFTGIFAIVTNVKQENMELAKLLGIQNVVYWPSFREDVKGPLSEFVPCGLEIECGPKDMPLIEKQLKQILQNLLDKRTVNVEQSYFEVYGSLSVKDADESKVNPEEFTEVKIKGESFYPILIDQYLEQGIKCFKMKKRAFKTAS